MKKDVKFLSNLLIFLVVFFKFLLIYEFDESLLLKILPIFVVICIFGILRINKFDRKVIFNTIVISIPILIVSLMIKSPNFLFPILLALVSLKRDFKSIAKTFGYSILFFVFFTIFLNYLGYLPNNDLLRLIDGVYEVRHSLGFGHPNSLMGAVVCSMLCLMYAYSFDKKKNIIFFIISLVFYYITYSRTPFLMFLVALFLDFFRKRIFKDFHFKIAPYFDIITFSILILSTILYSYFNFKELDILFSYRLSTNNLFINSGYLFGLLPNMSILDSLIIDNYHFSIIIRFGLIGFCLYMLYNIKTLKKLSYDDDLMIIVIAFAISGLTEGVAMVSSYNFIMTLQMMIFLNSNILVRKG